MGELAARGCTTGSPGMDRRTRLSYMGCGAEPHGAGGGPDVAEPSRHWDGAGLERKIRAAGRQWAVGDIAMVADGQWAVGAQSDGHVHEVAVVERRIADGRRVELTLEELARAVGARPPESHRDGDPA